MSEDQSWKWGVDEFNPPSLDVTSGAYVAHRWQPQKWEYEVVYFSGTLDHAVNVHHLKELGEDCWELFKQVYLEAPVDVTICTFKRPKAEAES